MKYYEEPVASIATLYVTNHAIVESVVQYVGQWTTRLRSNQQLDQQEEEVIGRDWLWIEELGGIFYTSLKLRKELIVIDQPMHCIRCETSKARMFIRNITFVIPIEDVTIHVAPVWKVILQDACELQEWTIHFPSRYKMFQWIEHLRQVVLLTKCSATFRECIYTTST